MQEIHSMGGTRFFGGGGGAAGGGDRRLRPHHHHHSHVQNNSSSNNNNNNNHQQALKCPRCDSLNTKFCYYNNYNLSQPRHFCKNCRRYWTKGGVLRNVPVGGGCRKSKRSNKTKNTSNATTASSSETTTSPQQHQHQPPPDQQKSNSHSSSESSSLTAAAAAAAVTELNSESSNNNLHESSNLLIPSSNPGLESGTGGGGALEQGAGGDCGGIFSEIGTFTSLIASSSSNNDALTFGFGGGVTDAASFQWQHQKLPEGLSGSGGSALLDHGHGAVTVDFSAMQGRTGNVGFGPLDWQGGADQGLFDLPNAVDQAYWSHTQWPDQDNSALFHLP